MRSISEQPAFLAEVDRRIERALSWDREATWSDLPVMAAAARHLCLAPGGKRARPRMVHLLGLAVGAEPDGMADVAVGAELIHAASLMHDDVIDQGAERRGRPTVNARWGNLTAVLAGDLLLSESILGLHRLDREITREGLQLVADMTRAAMLEAQIRGRVDVLPSQWRYIAEGKTGAMFRWCGRSVARLAGDPVGVERLGQFGERFGVAFQMADDLKDLLGGDIGKDRYADIKNANPSYVLSLAMQASPALRAELHAAWSRGQPLSGEELGRLGQMVVETGALAETHRALGAEIAASIEALGEYRDRPGCAEMVAWALMMWRSFAMEEAV